MKKIYRNNLPILAAIFLITGAAAYLLLFWRASAFNLRCGAPRMAPYAGGGNRASQFGTILLYHNIDGKGPFSVDLDVLRGHFALLRDSGIRVISLADFVGRLGAASALDSRTVAISFDEGSSLCTQSCCRSAGSSLTP
jgi:hypothetical protein